MKFEIYKDITTELQLFNSGTAVWAGGFDYDQLIYKVEGGEILVPGNKDFELITLPYEAPTYERLAFRGTPGHKIRFKSITAQCIPDPREYEPNPLTDMPSFDPPTSDGQTLLLPVEMCPFPNTVRKARRKTTRVRDDIAPWGQRHVLEAVRNGGSPDEITALIVAEMTKAGWISDDA